MGKVRMERGQQYLLILVSRFRCNTDCETDPENCISERLFMLMADMMVTGGWRQAGYEYLMMDDCWSSHSRTDQGHLTPDTERFPSGNDDTIGWQNLNM